MPRAERLWAHEEDRFLNKSHKQTRPSEDLKEEEEH